MRKQIFFLLSICLVVISCSNPKEKGFTLNGKLTNAEDGIIIELVPGACHNNNIRAIVSDTVKSGIFRLKVDADEPRLYSIRKQGTYGGYNIVLANDEVVFEAVYSESKNDQNSWCYFDEVSVTGAPLHEEYLEKISFRKALDKIYENNRERFKDVYTQLAEAHKAGDTLRLEAIKKSQRYKELTDSDNDFFQEVSSRYTKLIHENSDSWWGPMLMLNQMSYFSEEQKMWYNNFSQEAKDSYYGQLVFQELYPLGLIGKSVPELTMNVNDSSEINIISDNLGKRYTIIDFWASWCAPCRNEIPNLKKIYEKYSSEGLQIISISIDKNKEDWSKALEEEKFQWPQFIDNGDFADIYNIRFVPAVFLVDENGILIDENIRGVALEDKIKNLFEN